MRKSDEKVKPLPPILQVSTFFLQFHPGITCKGCETRGNDH